MDRKHVPSDVIKWTLEALRDGLRPFVEARVGKKHNSHDVYVLLRAMKYNWESQFHDLEKRARTCVHDLLDSRNEHAHQKSATWDDAWRCCDSAFRLLTSVGADNSRVQGLKDEVVREIRPAQEQPQPRPSDLADTQGRTTHGERIRTLLRDVYPLWLTNSEIGQRTGITPHQAVFQNTQSLFRRGRIEGEMGAGRVCRFRLKANS